MGYSLVEDNEGLVLTSKKEGTAVMIYQQVILLMCLIILACLGYLTFSGYSVQNYENNIKEGVMEDLITDLLKTDQNKETFMIRKSRSYGTNIAGQRKQIEDAERNLMRPSVVRRDQELVLKENFNALEKIIPAPMAVALLAQIVNIAASSPRDFELDCPPEACKHLFFLKNWYIRHTFPISNNCMQATRSQLK